MQIKVLSKLIEVLKWNAQKLRWNKVKLRISKVVRINAKTVAPFIFRAYLYWTGILWFLLLFFNCSRRQNVKFAIYDVKIGIYFITQWLVAHQNKYLEYEPFSNVILLLFTNIKICQKSFLTLLIVEGCFGIKE